MFTVQLIRELVIAGLMIGTIVAGAAIVQCAWCWQ